jgi:hypothetical protein
MAEDLGSAASAGVPLSCVARVRLCNERLTGVDMSLIRIQLVRTKPSRLVPLTLLLTLAGCLSGEDPSQGSGVDERGTILGSSPLAAEHAEPAATEAAPAPDAAPAPSASAADRPAPFTSAPEVLASSLPSDSIGDYSIKCDLATGIHVPAFNCDNGLEVPQGYQLTGLTFTKIGGVNPPASSQSGSSVTIISGPGTSGADMWNNADQFVFGNLAADGGALIGDGFIEVKVNSLGNTDTYAKAGVMFRDTLAAGSKHVMLAVTPGGGVMLQRRTTTNGAATNTNNVVTGSGMVAPIWLRLTRSGDTFTGFTSPDRSTWSQVGSAVTLTGFNANAYSGLAVSSHNTGANTTATFDKFTRMRVPSLAASRCDAPNALHGQCDPYSRFQVLAQSRDATVVANCRKQGGGAGLYGDIAVIQYNKSNGAICFYQSYGQNATNVPAPMQGSNATFTWQTPQKTWTDGCTACHDNGGFIRSPYIKQLGLLPTEPGYDNWSNPLRYVGNDFASDKSWSITPSSQVEPAGYCTACHRLAVNNLGVIGAPGSSGTAMTWAYAATNSSVWSWWKSPDSVFSPRWMGPSTSTDFVSDPVHQGYAQFYSDCAYSFAQGTTGVPAFDVDHPPSGCNITPLGTAWDDGSTYINDVTLGAVGPTSRTQLGSVHTMTAAGKDIYGTSDEALFSMVGITGDGAATVKVTSISPSNPPTDPYAKAGLMIRNGIGADAPNVMQAITPSGAQFQYRPDYAAQTTSSTPIAKSIPTWLRLVRSGSTFVGFFSNDLVNWTQTADPITVDNLSYDSLLMGMAVTSHKAGTPMTATLDHFAWTPYSTQTLVDADVGITTAAQAGSRSELGSSETIVAGGSDIYNSADQFHYAFTNRTGDVVVTARVTSLGATDPWAKAGLMIRSSSAGGASNAMIEVTASQGAQFQYRSTANQATSKVTVTGNAAPKWLRLTRSGNTFKGEMANASSGPWTQVGSTVTINGFAAKALIGLAVTSHNVNSKTTATFTDVTFAP